MRTIGLSNILRGSNKSLCASGEADAGIKAEPAGRRKSRPFSPIDGRRFGESPEFSRLAHGKRDGAHFTHPAAFVR